MSDTDMATDCRLNSWEHKTCPVRRSRHGCASPTASGSMIWRLPGVYRGASPHGPRPCPSHRCSAPGSRKRGSARRDRILTSNPSLKAVRWFRWRPGASVSNSARKRRLTNGGGAARVHLKAPKISDKRGEWGCVRAVSFGTISRISAFGGGRSSDMKDKAFQRKSILFQCFAGFPMGRRSGCLATTTGMSAVKPHTSLHLRDWVPRGHQAT